MAEFVRWYNTEHRHSGIRFVTPEVRHAGAESVILAKRKEVYEEAKRRNPIRWTGSTRNWSAIVEVRLNPLTLRGETAQGHRHERDPEIVRRGGPRLRFRARGGIADTPLFWDATRRRDR